jgi:hypothetical protein
VLPSVRANPVMEAMPDLARPDLAGREAGIAG